MKIIEVNRPPKTDHREIHWTLGVCDKTIEAHLKKCGLNPEVIYKRAHKVGQTYYVPLESEPQ